MAGGAQSDEDGGIISDINVTPLVDVVLVLLIILMVTAKQLVQQEQIPVELPTATSADPAQQNSEPATLTVSVEQDGKLHLSITQGNEQTLALTEVTQAQLGERAAAAHAADVAAGRTDPAQLARAILSADARVSHGDVITIIDILRNSGVNRFAINTRQPSTLPSAEGSGASAPSPTAPTAPTAPPASDDAPAQ